MRKPYGSAATYRWSFVRPGSPGRDRAGIRRCLGGDRGQLRRRSGASRGSAAEACYGHPFNREQRESRCRHVEEGCDRADGDGLSAAKVSVREGASRGNETPARHWGNVALSGRRREGPAAVKRTQADGNGSKYTVGVLLVCQWLWHTTSSAGISSALSTSR